LCARGSPLRISRRLLRFSFDLIKAPHWFLACLFWVDILENVIHIFRPLSLNFIGILSRGGNESWWSVFFDWNMSVISLLLNIFPPVILTRLQNSSWVHFYSSIILVIIYKALNSLALILIHFFCLMLLRQHWPLLNELLIFFCSFFTILIIAIIVSGLFTCFLFMDNFLIIFYLSYLVLYINFDYFFKFF